MPAVWAPSTAALARMAGVTPREMLRFDGNTPPEPLPGTRPEVLADALAEINSYPHGGYPGIHEAIADYAGVQAENVVLGAGADDLIMLVARSYAGPGDVIAIPQSPTYPIYAIAAALAGASVGTESPVLTFLCRPGNPLGDLPPIPDARPLAVDEAYFEYADGETAVPLLDDGVIVIRTFSKIFGLAAARIGYLLAERETAAALAERQAPAQVSTLSVALALAALESRPDPAPVIEERDRLTEQLRTLGFAPLPSHANFVYVRVDDVDAVWRHLVLHRCVVRRQPGGIRISIRNREDDDVLLRALAAL